MDLNEAKIGLLNVSEGERFAYPLILVKGYVSGVTGVDRILVLGSVQRSHPIRDHSFEFLQPLNSGLNQLVLRCGWLERECRWYYEEPSGDYVVTPVFITGGCGSAIDEDEVKQVKQKIQGKNKLGSKILLGCTLIQTFVAETMRLCGHGRKTFLLENVGGCGDAEDWKGGCLVLESNLQGWERRELSPEELWERVGREIMSSKWASANRKFVAFLRGAGAKLAIGGGGLALCGLDYITPWPESVDHLHSLLTPSNHLSTVREMSALSWSLGAVCHELCHTLDLGHTSWGIMGRHYDRIGLLFEGGQRYDSPSGMTPNRDTVLARAGRRVGTSEWSNEGELRDARGRRFAIRYSTPLRQRAADINGNYANAADRTDSLYWSHGCSTILAYHRWINNGIEKASSDDITYDQKRCIIRCSSGIIVVQLRNEDGFVLKSWEFREDPKKIMFLVPAIEVINKHEEQHRSQN